MALAELTKLIGQPSNWKPPPGDSALALAIASTLDRRRCPGARPILAAAKMKRSEPLLVPVQAHPGNGMGFRPLTR